jgi:hydrogenase-4 component I
MLKIFLNRFKQGHRTVRFPKGQPPALPQRYRGRPVRGHSIDLGKTLFNPDADCKYSNDFRMAASRREDLILSDAEMKLGQTMQKEMLKIFGRSLKLRQVSAGGCNACESDLNVLNTVVFDLGRFGIQFVASPRHADGVVVTGPVTKNMREALIKTYQATPGPKFVVAVGSCAISGGLFSDSDQVSNGLDSIVPVDLFIPGCPPHPLTILDGLLRLIGKIKK